MNVYNNIDGVWRSNNTTKININGTWKNASSFYNNISGAWKNSVVKYTVVIIHNKSVYSTITVEAGSTIALPSASNITNLYGYATSSSSTTLSYSPGQTIKVNNNITLYTLFRSALYASIISSGITESITIPNYQTITISVSSGSSTNVATPTIQTNGSAPYIKIGNYYIAHSNNGSSYLSVEPGTIITIKGYSYSSPPNNGASCRIEITYEKSSTIINSCV